MSLSAAELLQFHQDILDYLTVRSRIMSARRLSTWNQFAAYFNYQYSDFSREDLRKEFLTVILPKVFKYNLTSIQRRKVEIFATHYHFNCTDEGFQEIVDRNDRPLEGVHYTVSEADAQLPQVSCVVHQPDAFLPTTSADMKISAWTSAVNSSDEEIANFCLHRGKWLRIRVANRRTLFQQHGEMPENLQLGIVKKIIGFRNSSQEVSSCVNDGYFETDK